MPFNTNTLISILLSDSPSVEAFQQALNETDTPSFSEVSDTVRSTLSETLGVDLADRGPSELFCAALFTHVMQRLHSPTPGLLLMATLTKLHELNDDHYLAFLMSAITMAASLPTESNVILGAAALPLTLAHRPVKTLQANILRLMATTHITDKQIQCYKASVNTAIGAPAFARLLKNHTFDWQANETALNTLLPNEAELFTAIGFFHAEWTAEHNPAIAMMALKKGHPRPLPYIPTTEKNICLVYYPLLASAFLDPDITIDSFKTLIAVFRFRNISLNHDFNRALLKLLLLQPITDEEKLNALMGDLHWNPSELFVVSTAADGTPVMQSFMSEATKLGGMTIFTNASLLLTLPTTTVDRELAKRCIHLIRDILQYDSGNKKDIPIITKRLLQNPGLNTPGESVLKTDVINEITYLLNQQLSRATNTTLIVIICQMLLDCARFDNEALQRLIQRIQSQEKRQDACVIFDAIIDDPRLTLTQKAELAFKTKDKREDSDELLIWPEAITQELASKPEVVALRTAISSERYGTGSLHFSEAAPYLPANKKHAYHLLPLALTSPSTLQFKNAFLAYNDNFFFSPHLSLLVFRNNQLKPTHKGLYNAKRPRDTMFLLNLLLFSLLGHTPDIFHLPTEENDYCLDSYIDAIIRLTIHTKMQANRPDFLDMLNVFQSQYDTRAYNQSTHLLRSLLSLTSLARKNGDHYGIKIKELTSAFYTTFRRYIEESPAIRDALYQTMLLDERCVMEGALFNKEIFQNDVFAAIKELRKATVLPETLTALKSNLDVPNVSDFRSAMLLIALSEHADLNEMITQHLLHKTLNDEEKKQLIDALALLPQETFAALKETIIAWLTENSERRVMTRQLIDNQSHETNPLLLILRVGKTSYIPKETKHYKKLKTQLQADVSALQPKEPMEEELQSMRAPREEAALPAEAIKRKSIEFIEANAQGKVTWSNTAPFLPVSMPEGLLPLEQFSVAEFSMFELITYLNHPGLPRLFILFIFRHETLPILDWGNPYELLQNASFVYLITFTLFGKDEPIFKLEADEKHHLLSYEAAMIKQAIEPPQHAIKLFESQENWATRSEKCIILAYAPNTSFAYNELKTITYEILVKLYHTYVERSVPIAKALYQAYLRGNPSLLFPKQPGDIISSSAQKTLASTMTVVRNQQATNETLEEIKESIFDAEHFKLASVVNLVLYIALSPNTTAMDDLIKRHLVDTTVTYELRDNTFKGLCKLSPEKRKYLKDRLNNYCARHEHDENVKQLAVAIEAKDKSKQPVLLWLLTLGQNSLEVKSNGHYITQLGLFLNNKIKPKNAEKYGLLKPQ